MYVVLSVQYVIIIFLIVCSIIYNSKVYHIQISEKMSGIGINLFH